MRLASFVACYIAVAGCHSLAAYHGGDAGSARRDGNEDDGPVIDGRSARDLDRPEPDGGPADRGSADRAPVDLPAPPDALALPGDTAPPSSDGPPATSCSSTCDFVGPCSAVAKVKGWSIQTGHFRAPAPTTTTEFTLTLPCAAARWVLEADLALSAGGVTCSVNVTWRGPNDSALPGGLQLFIGANNTGVQLYGWMPQDADFVLGSYAPTARLRITYSNGSFGASWGPTATRLITGAPGNTVNELLMTFGRCTAALDNLKLSTQ